MIRMSTPCPACGRAYVVYQAVINIAGSNGTSERGVARECTAAGCGWWEITPLPARRA